MTMRMTVMMTMTTKIAIAMMTMVMTVTCSLESMARQVRTATQRIERTPTWQFCHQAIVLSVLWSINNFCRFCHQATILSEWGWSSWGQRRIDVKQSTVCHFVKIIREGPIDCLPHFGELHGRTGARRRERKCWNKDWILILTLGNWREFWMMMVVWRIPAEQFCPSNDPGYCLRVDWMDGKPEDSGWISRILPKSYISMDVAIYPLLSPSSLYTCIPLHISICILISKDRQISGGC